MYRVRAEAVSGTKVYAGGKWLRCIGNKPVHVGERVWTDGRCVYGNFQESQQPPVITANNQEIIPIVTVNSGSLLYYTFYKGKLKPVQPADQHSANSLFTYNKYAKSFLCVHNNYVTGGYVYFYSDDFGQHVEEDLSFDLKGLLASNLDKYGNLFLLYIEDSTLYVKKITKDEEQIIHSVDLETLVHEVNASVPQPPDFNIDFQGDGHENPQTFYDHTAVVYANIVHCFIEDDKSWSVFITFSCSKETWATKGGFDETHVSRGNANYYLSHNGIEHDPYDIYSYEETDTVEYSIPTPNPDRKVPLQNGFYFKEIFTTLTFDGDDVPIFEFYIKRIFFEPNDKEIFTGIFPIDSKVVFGKVKGGYLMAVVGEEQYPSEYTGNFSTKIGFPYFINGIFLFSSGKWQMLTDEYSRESCLNQRLIPMKKITNWTRRIQDFILN